MYEMVECNKKLAGDYMGLNFFDELDFSISCLKAHCIFIVVK